MRETLFDVWVVETHPYRMPKITNYRAVRVGEDSISVMDHGRLSYIRADEDVRWFVSKEDAKAHVRAECERLRAKLESELSVITQTLADDQYTFTRVPHERPKLWDAPLKLVPSSD